MYFFKKQGRQYLDLTGNLILSHNDRLIKARSTSAAPYKALNAKFVVNAGDLTLRGKIKATILALRFIWGKPQPLLSEDTGLKTSTSNKKDPNEYQCEDDNGNPLNQCDECPR